MGIGGGEYSTVYGGEGKYSRDIDLGLTSDNSASSAADVDSATNLGLSVGGRGKGGRSMKTSYVAGDVTLGSNAAARGGMYGPGMYGGYPGYGMYGAGAKAGSNLLIGGGEYSTIYGGDGKYGRDIDLSLSSKNAADAAASGKSATNLEVVAEACICQDSVGRERKYG